MLEACTTKEKGMQGMLGSMHHNRKDMQGMLEACTTTEGNVRHAGSMQHNKKRN